MKYNAFGKSMVFIMILIGLVLGVILFYTVVHEGGHALAVLLFGGEVTRFEVNFLFNSPHISYVGIADPMQKAVISLAGPLFPLLFLGGFIILLPKAKNIVTHGILFLLVVGMHATILVSVIIAITHGLGSALPSEDISKFIVYSGANSFVVAGAFLLLLAIFIGFLVRVGKVKETFQEISKLRNLKEMPVLPMGPKILSGSVLVSVLLLVTQGIFYQEPTTPSFTYHTKITIAFEELESDSPRFYTFRVEEPTTYDFIYSLETNSEVILSLRSLQGESFAFNNRDSIVIYKGGKNLKQAHFTGFTLFEGDYALEITTDGPGFLTMHIDTRTPQERELEYLDVLAEVNSGTFSAESYQEEGYELVYQGYVLSGADQLLFAIPSASHQRQVSTFVMGDYQELSLEYVADGVSRTILDGFNAAIGYGLPAHKTQGEFWVKVEEGTVQLIVYVK